MKIKTLIVLFVLITCLIKAQPYGENLYPHGTSILSSGSYNTINAAGFLMAGYLPSSSSQPNFVVDKTDFGGNFTSSTGEFSNSYDVLYQSGSCGTPLVQANNCSGVSIIETALTSPVTINYALVGATDEGCFFATLDNVGAIVTNALYRFPSNATNPSKPIIIESSTTAGEYLVFGYYSRSGGGEMYCLRLNSLGGIVSSANYNIASGIEMIPKDLVISPYSPTSVVEVVVVGEARDFGGSAGFSTRGFFARLDEQNLTRIECYLCGDTPGGSVNDWFSSITVANLSSGTDGFVVGGHSEYVTSYPLWMMKFDRVGNSIWNYVYQPVTDNSNVPDAVAVVEGNSSAYGLTYYAAVTSTAGIMAVRMDDLGSPFLPTLSIDKVNEFVYNPSLTDPRAADISFVGSGSNDFGIHVYGTDDYINGINHYMAEAAFNGYSATGCASSNTYNNTMAPSTGPAWTSTVGFNPLQALTRCSNITINTTNLTASHGTLCIDATLSASGSNARMLVTGTEQLNENLNAVSVFPNPATDKIDLSFSVETNSIVHLGLTNSLGQTIDGFDEIYHIQNGKQTLEIDLEKLNLEKGIYFLNLQINNSVQKKKIIYLGN